MKMPKAPACPPGGSYRQIIYLPDVDAVLVSIADREGFASLFARRGREPEYSRVAFPLNTFVGNAIGDGARVFAAGRLRVGPRSDNSIGVLEVLPMQLGVRALTSMSEPALRVLDVLSFSRNGLGLGCLIGICDPETGMLQRYAVGEFDLASRRISVGQEISTAFG